MNYKNSAHILWYHAIGACCSKRSIYELHFSLSNINKNVQCKKKKSVTTCPRLPYITTWQCHWRDKSGFNWQICLILNGLVRGTMSLEEFQKIAGLMTNDGVWLKSFVSRILSACKERASLCICGAKLLKSQSLKQHL